MESLFAPRPFKRWKLILMLVGSLVVHGALVGLGVIFAGLKSYPIEETITQLDTGPVLGETVQELIAPKEDPVPTPDMPTPPPEETPPPEDTPPPSDEPDMEEPPKPTPAASAKPNAKPKPAGTPVAANVKRGDRPQEGVVGGVTTADKKTGTPGASHLGPAGGWRTPKPAYPYQARAAHLHGDGAVRITTDGSGNVSSAVITQSVGSAVLDSNTTSFARANWHGPPNSSTTVPITYQMQ